MILRGTKTDTVTVHIARKIKRKRGKDGDGRIEIVTEPEDKRPTGCRFERGGA